MDICHSPQSGTPSAPLRPYSSAPRSGFVQQDGAANGWPATLVANSGVAGGPAIAHLRVSRAPMFNMQRILILAVLTLTTSGMAGSLMDELSDRTVAQCLDLLESPDPRMRVGAAVSIEYRYLKPGVSINPPTWKEQHPELPLPPQVVPHLAEHLKSDSDDRVRLEAMRALGVLRSCTNTTPLVATGLEDTNAYVRIWTCSVLIDISHGYSEPLDARVIPTLREYLGVNNSEEPAWLAAWFSGKLGSAGKPLLPDLQNQAKHGSVKVQHYAHEAIRSIQKNKRQ
jgi:hypothetical protein